LAGIWSAAGQALTICAQALRRVDRFLCAF
jgi:hypothetical protein